MLEYRSRDERPLTSVRPSAPAAIRIYGADGCCVALCLDLDIGRGGTGAVLADEARLVAWMRARGARVITDRSPTGGVHVYVPLAQRTPFETAREIVEALAAAFPTLDPGPHRSLKTGCIRPPGAAHKTTGFQELTTPLATAYDVLRRPNAPEVLERIRTDLTAGIAAWRALRLAPDPATDGAATDLARPRHALSARLRAIAELGSYDHARYGSASEARQAVVAGAVAAGWTLADVAVRIADGRWPGLAAMYARYSPKARSISLGKDWHRAHAYLAGRDKRPGSDGSESHARKSHTSAPISQGGPVVGDSSAERDHIRTWRTVLRVVEQHRFPGRRGHLVRFVLRALGESASKTASRYVSFGTRSLAVATGVDHSTVAAALRMLAAEPGGWLDLIEPARGEKADLYELRIPDDLVDMAAGLGWDAGMAHSLRPAFRELGHVAALVFEAIEAHRAATITELVPATGLSRTAVTAAVETLQGYALVDIAIGGGGRQLHARAGRLPALAERLGVMEVVAAQLRRYALERQAWRAYLARFEASEHEVEFEIDDWWPPGELSPAGNLWEQLSA